VPWLGLVLLALPGQPLVYAVAVAEFTHPCRKDTDGQVFEQGEVALQFEQADPHKQRLPQSLS